MTWELADYNVLERIAISLEKLVELKTPVPKAARKKERTEALTNTINKWYQISGDKPWVDEEILKADAWILANPQKAPQRKARFLQNWLSRAWETRRKEIKPGKLTTDYSYLED